VAFRIPASGLLAATLALALVGATAARAGTATDALGRCLVQAATPSDNEVLVRWIFSAITENPKLSGLSSVTDAQRTVFDQQQAALFQRLLLKDCRTEALEAVRQDGAASIGQSFELLGSTAGRQLMTDPKVLAAMQHMTRYLDQTQWRDFAGEAGPAAPAAGTVAPTAPPPK